jgi:myo-inositol-1(or 4)-monophosphatase
MKDVLSFAVTIAREAGSLLKDAFATPHRITYKGDINIVTEADLMAENHLRERIRARFPDHDLMAEESADAGTGAEYRWVVDPLDGTTNYAHGYPVFCVSVALEHRGQIVLGAVYNPMLDECFSSLRGGGAFLNGRSLSVSRTDALTRSLLATGFPYDIRESLDNNLDHFKTLALKAQAIRRAGSAALDLAYVAAGRFDGFWELKLAPWDTAAGWLLVEEAGGRVTNLDGGPYHLYAPHILASNGTIHPALLDLLRQA